MTTTPAHQPVNFQLADYPAGMLNPIVIDDRDHEAHSFVSFIHHRRFEKKPPSLGPHQNNALVRPSNKEKDHAP